MANLKKNLDVFFDELENLNQYIYDHPELGDQEFKACKAHVEILNKHGFKVVEGYADIETAFKAEYDSGKAGPTIAFLDEYDALPEIGHGCGHNMIGTIGTGAGILLKSVIDEIGGKVLVIGTPAEETNGAKVYMADKGVFDSIDIVLMAHPNDVSYVSIESLAMEAIEYEFLGKTAHAAAEPEKGINALDAVIQTFNSINALREHIVSSARVHGIIKEGGVAANIVPERAVAHFYVRAKTKTYLKELIEKVNNCAKGAALATGCKLNISNYEIPYDNFVVNKTLTKVLEKNMRYFEVDQIEDKRTSLGSVDAGNVSQICPTLHPMFAISEGEIVGHTRTFAESTIQTYAIEQMRKMILTLTQTAVDIIESPETLKAIWLEFENTEK